VAYRLAVGVSYMYVHGVDLIRARDVNLPPPVNVEYPVYDSTGTNFLGTFYNVQSFATWQMTASFTCPYPPCINPLARPIPQLGAIDVFESAASSIYNGMTVSIHRQMTTGIYFRIAYTFAKAIDDGQDALVAGVPAVVQNTYNTAAEKGLSVTDQRHRLMFAWIADPKPFGREQPVMAKMFNDWKLAGVLTFGSGRPENVLVSGDPNQDGNDTNESPSRRRPRFVYRTRLCNHRRAPDPPPVHARTPEAGCDPRIFQPPQSRQQARSDHRKRPGDRHRLLRKSQQRTRSQLLLRPLPDSAQSVATHKLVFSKASATSREDDFLKTRIVTLVTPKAI
jgi:hypothetical protein